jgi:hypothetical protein
MVQTKDKTKNQPQLVAPIPFDQPRWQVIPERFDDRTVRHRIRSVNDSDITSLRQQIDILATIIQS